MLTDLAAPEAVAKIDEPGVCEGRGGGSGDLLIYLFTYLKHVSPHPCVNNSLAKPLSMITVNSVWEMTIVQSWALQWHRWRCFSSPFWLELKDSWTGCNFRKPVLSHSRIWLWFWRILLVWKRGIVNFQETRRATECVWHRHKRGRTELI